MGPASVLAMLALTGVVVLGCMAVVIRFDLSARAERARFERQVRHGAARLVHEAERARRVGPR
ncbi:hypothetical protein [uncultured Amnibacterium sp.]|uniref:hypothetical protein n=1 Tax=uncultured Amnibacterium sp. TaxID=1631851 RepID=UPI0035C9497D